MSSLVLDNSGNSDLASVCVSLLWSLALFDPSSLYEYELRCLRIELSCTGFLSIGTFMHRIFTLWVLMDRDSYALEILPTGFLPELLHFTRKAPLAIGSPVAPLSHCFVTICDNLLRETLARWLDCMDNVLMTLFACAASPSPIVQSQGHYAAFGSWEFFCAHSVGPHQGSPS